MMSLTKRFLLGLQSILYIAAGLNHFINPDFYLRMMPPYLPWPTLLHLTAGVLEVVGGALLLFPPLRHWAAWGLVLLLLAVYPANLHVAFNHHLYPEIPLLFHWIRLPLQFLLIAWAWWFTRRK
ncbi:MAG: MauE/DoxX family redox-associated membrane protein [Acidobacteriota bacterium]